MLKQLWRKPTSPRNTKQMSICARGDRSRVATAQSLCQCYRYPKRRLMRLKSRHLLTTLLRRTKLGLLLQEGRVCPSPTINLSRTRALPTTAARDAKIPRIYWISKAGARGQTLSRVGLAGDPEGFRQSPPPNKGVKPECTSSKSQRGKRRSVSLEYPSVGRIWNAGECAREVQSKSQFQRQTRAIGSHNLLLHLPALIAAQSFLCTTINSHTVLS